MREFGERRTVIVDDDHWWLKTALMALTISALFAYGGYKRSLSLEHAIIGEQDTLADTVWQQKELDRQWKEYKSQFETYETHGEADRNALTAIIKGAF